MTDIAVPSRYSLAEAEPIAASIVEVLAPFCQRIEVAGSIRRKAPTIGDVELVVIPSSRQQVLTLFDDGGLVGTAPLVDCLDEALSEMLAELVVKKRPSKSGRTSWGPSDKRMLWRHGVGHTDWIGVDVFGARPQTWGAKLCLRTGPWELSRRLVTHRGGGRDGVLAGDLIFRDGGLYRYDRTARRHFVPTPDEHTLFRELGLPYLPPEHRTASTFQTVDPGAR